jgi:hypothetical protein
MFADSVQSAELGLVHRHGSDAVRLQLGPPSVARRM